jgi:ribosomal protein S18 acetylase RimI-like enzyme
MLITFFYLLQCFAEQATKYVAVRKFVKKSVKTLSTLSTEFSEMLGSNFWVAEVYRDSIGESNEGVIDDLCIVGCIGLKAATAAVDWSQPTPDSIQKLPEVRGREGSNRDNKGTQTTTDTQEHRGEISHMCVSKSHRGKGLARALLDHLLHYASTTSIAPCNDLDRMQSGVTTHGTCTGTQSRFSSLDLTVLCDLTVARSLYISKGFTDQGPPSDLGHGCLLQHMTLSLPSAVVNRITSLP